MVLGYLRCFRQQKDDNRNQCKKCKLHKITSTDNRNQCKKCKFTRLHPRTLPGPTHGVEVGDAINGDESILVGAPSLKANERGGQVESSSNDEVHIAQEQSDQSNVGVLLRVNIQDNKFYCQA